MRLPFSSVRLPFLPHGPILKPFLPRTLFGRSLLIIITPMILVQIISTFVFYERHWELITRRLSGALAGEIAIMADLRESGTKDAVLLELRVLARDQLWLHSDFRDGDILPNVAAEADGPVATILSRELSERVRRPFRIDLSDADDAKIEVQLADGVLEVVTTKKRLISHTSYVVVLWMVGSSLILFAVAIVFMRNQIRPIRRLAVAADRFGKGQESPGFKPEGASEVRQAASAFLRMRDRLKRQMDQRTEMLAGVSHDLRTPLTRMRLQLALMPGDDPSVAEIGDDIVEMERMLNGYLAFARGEGTEQPEEVDLALLLEDLVNAERRAGTHVAMTAADSLPFVARPTALKRAIGNLLANAGRYGTRVVVGIRRLGAQVTVTIDDNGPGIPEAHREDVFRPFFRIDASRNPETGGTGLGLTIARDIVRGHGGEIMLSRSPQGGVRAEVTLPI
ncbi:MAG: ATP-binding protein [Alphaproteobacteria bacterium]|nr:ATP-binding protein [Alphaproteobacteria bacterium]